MRKIAITALAGLAATLPAIAQQQSAPSAQVLAERASAVRGLAREPLDVIARVREVCAAGQAPANVARGRGFGAESMPDAADSCASALNLIGRAGQLGALYKQLQRELGGGASGHEQLPSAIATAVLKTKTNQAHVGNDRAAIITAALAFDAGFTVAYGKGERPAAGMPEINVLKPIAERCLAPAEANLGLCYSTGYVYGARGVSGLPLMP